MQLSSAIRWRRDGIKSLTIAAMVSALGLWNASAQAVTIDLNLTGTVANGAYSTFDSGGLHYDYWNFN
jgi:hypothetical protein